MVQIREATAGLRLVLADIKGREGREAQLDTMVHQFRTQLDRLPKQAIYGRTSLDLALSAMAEIQERLDHAVATRQHLLAIKQRTSDELAALELTQRVEEAKETLRDLKSRPPDPRTSPDDVEAEVRRIQEFIAEYSKRAERSITGGQQEDEG